MKPWTLKISRIEYAHSPNILSAIFLSNLHNIFYHRTLFLSINLQNLRPYRSLFQPKLLCPEKTPTPQRNFPVLGGPLARPWRLECGRGKRRHASSSSRTHSLTNSHVCTLAHSYTQSCGAISFARGLSFHSIADSYAFKSPIYFCRKREAGH